MVVPREVLDGPDAEKWAGRAFALSRHSQPSCQALPRRAHARPAGLSGQAEFGRRSARALSARGRLGGEGYDWNHPRGLGLVVGELRVGRGLAAVELVVLGTLDFSGGDLNRA